MSNTSESAPDLPVEGKKNERAFAIFAPPDRIWRTLIEEVRLGVESGRAQIVRQEAPRVLLLDVRLGWGLYVRYEYQLTPLAQATAQDRAGTEVAVTVAPFGLRHAIASIITFGRALTPHMLAVTQGLANLKETVETDANGSA